MRYLVWGLVALLLVLRQDHWNWDNTELMWGFLPGGLFAQACISISAACVWWLAVTFAWPVDPDEAIAGGPHPVNGSDYAADREVDPSEKAAAEAAIARTDAADRENA